MYIVNVNCLHIHKIQYNKKVCTNTFVFVHEYVCDMNCLFVFVQMAMVYCICSHLLVYLSKCEQIFLYICECICVCSGICAFEAGFSAGRASNYTEQ